jgi:hypothetical protein
MLRPSSRAFCAANWNVYPIFVAVSLKNALSGLCGRGSVPVVLSRSVRPGHFVRALHVVVSFFLFGAARLVCFRTPWSRSPSDGPSCPFVLSEARQESQQVRSPTARTTKAELLGSFRETSNRTSCPPCDWTTVPDMPFRS